MSEFNLYSAFGAAADIFDLADADLAPFSRVPDCSDAAAVKSAIAESGLDARYMGDQVVLSVNFPVMAASHMRLGKAVVLLYKHGGAMLVTGSENWDETLTGEYFGEFISADSERELWKQQLLAAIFVDGIGKK